MRCKINLVMPQRKGKRQIAAMKDHLYKKVLTQPTFSAFDAMVNAGTTAASPTVPPITLQNIATLQGYNTNYGVAYTQIVAGLMQGVNNYLVQKLSNIPLSVAKMISPSLGQFPFNPPVNNGQQYISSLGEAYDTYVKQCKQLVVPAVFDETYFDSSVFQPAYNYQMQNNFCTSIEKKLHEFLTNVQRNNIAFNIQTLGVGKTNAPTAEELMYNAVQGTGAGEILQPANVDPPGDPPGDPPNDPSSQGTVNFFTLPDLSQYALSFLAVLNQVLSSGVALDAAWFDRSSFSTDENNYQLLADGFRLQNLAQWFGMVLDFTPFDLSVLVPEFPEGQPTTDDLFTLLTAEKAIISVFATLFAQHMYDPSLGGTKISQSQRVGSYADAYDVYLRINEIIKKKYSNVMYAQMVVDAATEIARYPYRANLSYTAGVRSLPYDQFLTYWRSKWLTYGVSQTDLQYAQQLGERFQPGAARQSEQKLQQVGQYAKTYKPLFYRKNYAGVGSEVS